MTVQRIDMERMRAQLIYHEGLFLKSYRCPTGKLTIGVGYNIDAHGLPSFVLTHEELKNTGITKKQAMLLLDNQIQETAESLDHYLSWWRGRPEIRMRIMLDMAFNLGIHGFLAFKNTLAFIAAGQYDLAATGMLRSKWATQVKGRAVRLARMMRTGEDSKDF